jgi:diaminopimelate epimerase
VEFVRVIDRNNVEIRIWERGVGETLSSGTCSCGAALASMINDFTDRRVKVQTEGGTINVEWRDDDQLVMTGRADLVYQGQWLGEQDD